MASPSRAVLGALTLWLASGATQLATACIASSKNPWLTLKLSATGRTTDQPERVRVHSDGCVYVDGFDKNLYALALTSSELSTLQSQVNSLPANAFNAPWIQAQVQNRSVGSTAGVVNGDRHELTLTVGRSSHAISWYGLYFDQERFPDIAELSALAGLSRVLRAYAFDTRLAVQP